MYPLIASTTPGTCWHRSSTPQKHPPAKYAVWVFTGWLIAGRSSFPSFFSMNSSDTEFRQYRRPVGLGPSSNTCPRCAPQRSHRISVRTIPRELSECSATWSLSKGWKKLGQPVPELNFASLENSGSPHSRQMYTPSLWLATRFPQNAGSVPLFRITLASSGLSFLANSSIFACGYGAMSYPDLEYAGAFVTVFMDVFSSGWLARPSRPTTRAQDAATITISTTTLSGFIWVSRWARPSAVPSTSMSAQGQRHQQKRQYAPLPGTLPGPRRVEPDRHTLSSTGAQKNCRR